MYYNRQFVKVVVFKIDLKTFQIINDQFEFNVFYIC
jgi:hypothetical protein